MFKLFRIKGFIPYLAIIFLNAGVDLAHKITIQNVLLKSFSGETQTILTALINTMILLPFVLFFSPAAFLNEKYSQTKIIRYSSLAAIGIATLICICYFGGQFYWAFGLTLVLAAQSAIYSPAKYSMIRAMVGAEKLGMANGIVQALTIVAILFSGFAFSFYFEQFYSVSDDPNNVIQSVSMIGIALVLLSMLEAWFAWKLPFYSQTAEYRENSFSVKKYLSLAYLKENLHSIRKDKNIWLSIVGLSLFWGVSQIVLSVFPTHYKANFHSDNALIIQGILAVSGLGLIWGSYIAGKWSDCHIEHGIVPVGALGIFFSLLGLTFAANEGILILCSLCFGFFGGLFIVPLNATIQFLASESHSGRIMAGNNFMQNILMIVFLLIAIVLVSFGISTRELFLFTAFVCLAGSLFAILQLPHLFARLLMLPIVKVSYRFYVDGLRNLPQTGGVLMLGNHISWIDWMLLQAASPRAIRFVMYRPIYNKWYLKWLFKFFRVIPIGAGASKESILAIRECLAKGEVVALFPEGHISYNGQINTFQKGFEFILKDLNNVTVVPFYLRGLWGSSFSRADSFYKQMTKKRGKREILVAFGKPIHQFIDATTMKQKVVELSFQAWERFIHRQKTLQHHWLENAKAHLFKACVVDMQGINLHNLKFISAVLLVVKQLKNVLSSDKEVGVLLPSSAISAIVNMALFVLGKVPVNLNYTLSQEVMEKALKKAHIQHVITSEKFLEKLANKGFHFDDVLNNNLIFAENIIKSTTKWQKIQTFLTALLAPSWLIKAVYFTPSKLDDTATILFSSGSEGEPKGIELSHKNLLTNIKQVSELLNFKKDDVILNSLPIFHSFGLTVTMLMPLCEGIKMVSCPDPTDSVGIGKMVARHGVSILFGTSTFFRLYTGNKKLHPLMFQQVRMVIAGAEKLKSDVRDAFRLKFGIDIYEGYGTTETAPVAAVNMPNILEPETLKEMKFNKEGTVGQPLPGTVIKIVDPDTLEELAIGEDGLILIGGGQVMKGYFNEPEKTEDVICELEGVRYYKTGDKGHIDEQGFLTIIDRYSRFAKVGGEMISLGAVEEALGTALGDESQFTITSIDDEKKGERLVLLIHSKLDLEMIKIRIKNSGLPPIMQPSSILCVENIPLLGSGKIDFKEAKKLAIEQLK